MLAWSLLFIISAKLIMFNKITFTSHDCVDLHCQNRSNFTDEKNLSIQLLFSFLLSFLMNSSHSEPNRFFKKHGRSDIPKSTVTKAAFAKARKTHKHRALLELNHKRKQFFENSFNPKSLVYILYAGPRRIHHQFCYDVLNHGGLTIKVQNKMQICVPFEGGK